ncbi:cyanophycin synthetase [Candidatus Parcubacteria bacterium]|nr:MAG: cyanophycin synthetase [Candidatus Parcubacteria bacterium]
MYWSDAVKSSRLQSMKKSKKEALLLPKLLQKIAPKIGARVLVEPHWGIVGQITFKGGRKSYFRYNTLDLNPVGASDVAKDKGFATYFMRKMGYPTVPGRTFFSDRWAKAIRSTEDTNAALRYARHRGFPLMVKPNSGSQGTHVSMVHNVTELRATLKEIFLDDRVALVQTYVRGKDYRIVVLDDQVISAYERIPLNIVGDGRATIAQLLKRKQRTFTESSRDTRIKLDDPRITLKLKQHKLKLNSVPQKGEQIFLLDNANLSSGGDAVDVTDGIHSDFKKLAIQLTKDMGLRLCGVDIMVSGSITERAKKYWILEVNAAPGLDHYVKTGKAQQKIVEDMYLEILKAMSKN